VRWLEEKGFGKGKVGYRLRDWLISRQRYWGTPIPAIHCPELRRRAGARTRTCPVRLPEDVEFSGPRATRSSSRRPSSAYVPEVRRAGPARDRHDGHVRGLVLVLPALSSIPGPKEMVDTPRVDRWLPVDQYIGGIEHAILHLLYARFVCRVLKDMELVTWRNRSSGSSTRE
jgi:leucyl-tRNA synthetase